MPTTDRKLRVFLCHASQDKPIVRDLYHRLLAEGWIDPWLDEEKLLPGQDWDIEIERAVESADAVIVCLSKSSVSKEGYIQKEIKKVLDISDHKLENAIFIIPLRLEDCKPPHRLSKWQYVDYFPIGSRDKTFQRLTGVLRIRANEKDVIINEFKKAYQKENNRIQVERDVQQITEINRLFVTDINRLFEVANFSLALKRLENEEEIFLLTAQKLLQTLNATHVLIIAFERELAHLRVAWPNINFRSHQSFPNMPIFHKLENMSAALIIGDSCAGPDLAPLLNILGEKTKSLMILPLAIEKTLQVLVIICWKETTYSTDGDITWATVITNQASIALDYAHLKKNNQE